MAKAARLAKIDRGAHYKRLRRDEDYRRLFAEAEQDAALALEDEVIRWAFEGYEEPVIYQGQLCYGPDAFEKDPDTGKDRLKANAKPLTRRRRSETLAMFLLKGKLPEKYKRTEMPAPAPNDGTQTWEEFLIYHRRVTTGDAAPPPSSE